MYSIKSEQRGGRGINGHRRGDLIQSNALEQALHVSERRDGNTDAAHFARGQRMVRIHAHLRRQIEGDAQTGDALREQIAIALVGFFRCAEAGVLPHGPQPRPIHLGIDAARIGELAGLRQLTHEREIFFERRKD
jgi:hypothetical protein